MNCGITSPQASDNRDIYLSPIPLAQLENSIPGEGLLTSRRAILS